MSTDQFCKRCGREVCRCSSLSATPIYPSMPRNEYEWLCCTVLHDQTMTLYRHRMSGRAVLVCMMTVGEAARQPVTLWMPKEIMTILKARF